MIDGEIRHVMLIEIERREEHHDCPHYKAGSKNQCDEIRNLEFLSQGKHRRRYYYRTKARPAQDALHDRYTRQGLSAAGVKREFEDKKINAECRKSRYQREESLFRARESRRYVERAACRKERHQKRQLHFSHIYGIHAGEKIQDKDRRRAYAEALRRLPEILLLCLLELYHVTSTTATSPLT